MNTFCLIVTHAELKHGFDFNLSTFLLRDCIFVSDQIHYVTFCLTTRSAKLTNGAAADVKAVRHSVVLFVEWLVHASVFATKKTKGKVFQQEQYMGKIDLAEVCRLSNEMYICKHGC